MKLNHIFTHEISPGRLFKIPEQPVNVMLDVTNYCNNRCRFCYNPNSNKYRDDSPDPDRLEKIVTILGETGTKEILYLGGEPFSGDIMGNLLEIGSKFEMFQRAVSNGSFFKDVKTCVRLKEKGLDEVGISFHSASSGIHDKIAGRKGAFEEARAGLANCAEAGIRSFIQYSPNTLNVENDILLLADFMNQRYREEIQFFDINRLLPIGVGGLAANLFLEDEQWFHLLTTATGLEEYGYKVHAELTPFCWLDLMAEKHSIPKEQLEKMHHFNRGCFMWVAQLPLDYHGRVKFCPAGPPVGPSLLDVQWPDFWREWAEFKEYRSFLWNDKCIDFSAHTACKYFYQCLGGCKYSKGNHYELDQYSQGM
jgi:AdoMet-dependent heme synthase